MNRFVASGSRLFLLVSWFIAIAFINDAANLTDIFPDTATLHFDEGDGVPVLVQIDGVNASGVQVAHHLARSTNFQHLPNGALKHVILDEDSPSIAAVSLYTEYASFLIPTEEAPVYQSHSSNSTLYLQNCTLQV
jgi:hypothetical protein